MATGDDDIKISTRPRFPVKSMKSGLGNQHVCERVSHKPVGRGKTGISLSFIIPALGIV